MPSPMKCARSTSMIISNPHPIRADSFKSSRSSNLFNSKTVQSPPVIEIEHVQFDDTPFSHSFLEVFEYYFQDNASSTPAICETNSEEAVELKECRDMTAEISFNVEQITDLGSMWIDDEIDEIVVITPKTTNHTLPLSTIPEDTFHSPYSDLTITYETSNFREMVATLPNLDDFDFPHCPSTRKCTCSTCFVRHRNTRQVYAVKRFSPSDMVNELSILEMLNEHDKPFVPKIRWRVFDEEGIVLVMDCYPGGSLLYYVLQEGPLESNDLLFYASEIAEGLSILHDAGIRHRDLNPRNVMIGADGHIVLAGFEYALSPLRKHSSVVPTTNDSGPRQVPARENEYRAPEALLGWTEDEAVDSWSFGCLVYFLVVGEHPFVFEFQEPRNKVLSRILFSEEWWDCEARLELKDLISKCIECNPKLRLDIRGIKNHRYFASVDWMEVNRMSIPAPYIPNYHSISKSTLGIPSKSGVAKTTTPISTPPLFSKTIEAIFQPAPSEPIQEDSERNNRLSIVTTSNQDHKSSSVYSLQARHSVQDLLPKIFRSPSLDEDALEDNKTRLSHPKVIESPPVIRAPSYERLKAQQDLSPEERMTVFWDTIDQDVKMSKSRNWFGKPTIANALPSSPSPSLPSSPNLSSSIFDSDYLKPRKLRKQRSSIITSQTQRISQLFTRSSMSNLSPNKLPKMKRTKSTPVFPSVDPTLEMHKIIETNEEHVHEQSTHEDKEMEPLDLPSGIEQIGSGIGFTFYNVPDASKTKASICSGQNMAGIGSGSRLGLGIGLGFGNGHGRFTPRKSNLFGGMLKSRSKAKPGDVWQDEVEGRRSLAQSLWSKRGKSTRWPPQMTPIRETNESESDAPRSERAGVSIDADTQRDVFRCGSTWSMLPDASKEILPGVVCIGDPEISPMTATDSTVGNSPFSELGPLEPGTRVLSESLKDILRGDRTREGRDTESYLDMGRATLRLIGSTSSLVLGTRRD